MDYSGLTPPRKAKSDRSLAVQAVLDARAPEAAAAQAEEAARLAAEEAAGIPEQRMSYKALQTQIKVKKAEYDKIKDIPKGEYRGSKDFESSTYSFCQSQGKHQKVPGGAQRTKGKAKGGQGCWEEYQGIGDTREKEKGSDCC